MTMSEKTSNNIFLEGGYRNTMARPTLYYGRIILGEITPLLAGMRKTATRWSSHQQDKEQDPLVQQLRDLQMTITHLNPDSQLESNIYLEPFLAIIRSEDTTGPVTKSALAAVNRMLNYGLIDCTSESAATTVEAVAAAVTHARFVGTDQGADEVVLWEILTVLRTLILGPVGHLLTNESVCEILNSSFRICFETRLSELLRNCTEDALSHMVQLLFARLPQFKDDPESSYNRKLKMRAGGGNDMKVKRNAQRYLRASPPPTPEVTDEKELENLEDTEPLLKTEVEDTLISKPVESDSAQEQVERGTDEIVNLEAQQENFSEILEETSVSDTGDSESPEDNMTGRNVSFDSGIIETTIPSPVDISHTHLAPDSVEVQGTKSDTEDISKSDTRTNETIVTVESVADSPLKSKKTLLDSDRVRKESLTLQEEKEEFFNLQGVKFTQECVHKEGHALNPYSLPCVREVFRFLISLTSPCNDQNTVNMILTALNLLTVALEVGAEHINQAPSLLTLVKDQLCRNLFMLMKTDSRPAIFMSALRVCTLLFESLRTHLKFQLEMFVNKLMNIIISESPNVSYSFKELSLETVVRLWRIPGLITELFLNYDCNLYASNTFEELTKVLSKNAFPVQGLYSTNLLSLEALLTVIETIDSHCPPKPKKKNKDLGLEQVGITQDNIRQSAVVAPVSSGYLLGLGLLGGYAPVTPVLKAKILAMEDQNTSRECLLAVKEKKRLLATGTDQFNVKPEKGIQFLQENGIIGNAYEDIALFLRSNPHLDKRVIGDYISKKKNVAILATFVKSFDFQGLRIDECLRTFLETFRLPGEAPVISIIIEQFSSHWHSSNGNQFGKDDAAFTLAYAVIMLNVDQHNQIAKKQNIPMTLDQFQNNLRGVNNGKDFEKKMLEEIYCAIRNEEIVMPAEQTGVVKENYLWKMLLRRGSTKEGKYLLSNPQHTFDRDLFALCWGPTIASLSYVFDKSNEDVFVQKALTGFKKCASIAARYGMSDVFDNLVVSLCKFTTLTTFSNESPEQVAISFGSNRKAQLAALTVFRLVIAHGDILRDGWKNILELLLQLFKCHLLSSSLIESEDFVEPSGKVSLVRAVPNNTPRVESGLFSSLYLYISLGDAGSARGMTPEDSENLERAKTCIVECHLEKLITESAFLRYDSLNELLKAVMGAGDANHMVELTVSTTMKSRSVGSPDVDAALDEHSQAFLLELVVSVLVANKDRAGGIWPSIRDHIYSLLMGAAATERFFLLERCIVAVLRISKVLLRRPELANPILQSLRMLLLLRPHILNRAALQVVAGIHEVLSVNADHIQEPSDWAVLFALLECAGAGAKPPPIVSPESHNEEPAEQESEGGVSSGMDSGNYTETCSGGNASDVDHSAKIMSEEVPGSGKQQQITSSNNGTESVGMRKQSRGTSPETLQNHGGWILVGREGEIEPVPVRAVSVNEWDIVHQRQLGDHKAEALFKAVDTLAFLVRERHITASSLAYVVQACRTFVEATLHGAKPERKKIDRDSIKSPTRRKMNRKNEEKDKAGKRPKSPNAGNSAYDADESDSEDLPVSYQQVSEKLLDLMDTLHTSSSHILSERNEEDSLPLESSTAWHHSLSLWHQALCPLLQGIARYCCDVRNSIRNLAMTYLQRALLNHDLQTLSAAEWESCFNKVLFPLLAKLLQPLGPSSNAALEETRVRSATLVQKVYLRHLTPLLSLPTFTALWLTILDFMDKYLNIQKSDHLSDAVPEILKNMLLVMETTQVFHTSEGFTHLWSITWDRIDAFLPNFRHDLFRSHPPSEIHRIEVVPSESAGPTEGERGLGTAKKKSLHSGDTCRTEPNPHDGTASQSQIEQTEDTEENYIPPSLREQQAVRLSLSQEELPTSLASSVILQPPLPHILPVSPSSSPPTCDSAGMGFHPVAAQTGPHLSQAVRSESTLPCLVPQSASFTPPMFQSIVEFSAESSHSSIYYSSRSSTLFTSSKEAEPNLSSYSAEALGESFISNNRQNLKQPQPMVSLLTTDTDNIPVVVSFAHQPTSGPIVSALPYNLSKNTFVNSVQMPDTPNLTSIDPQSSFISVPDEGSDVTTEQHKQEKSAFITDAEPVLSQDETTTVASIPVDCQVSVPVDCQVSVPVDSQVSSLSVGSSIFPISVPFFNYPFSAVSGDQSQLDCEPVSLSHNKCKFTQENQSAFALPESSHTDHSLASEEKVITSPFRPASLFFKSSAEDFPVDSTVSPTNSFSLPGENNNIPLTGQPGFSDSLD